MPADTPQLLTIKELSRSSRLSTATIHRLKKAGLAGATVVLKLKTHDFRILTRRKGLGRPTQYADDLYRTAVELLAPEIGRRRYRLIGVGAADLVELGAIEPELFGPAAPAGERVERVLDEVRARFGRDSIGKGRGLRPPPPRR